MRVAIDAPKNPALRLYGGKWNLAPWIISHFPAHVNYIEPCGGAASVLLRKPRSKMETYNDLYGHVVNFFRVLRDQPDELIRIIRLTPWARTEYEAARVPSNDPVENARRFWIGCTMGISGMAYSQSGMRMTRNEDTQSGKSPALVYAVDGDLATVAARLKGVQIENKSYSDIVEMYDHPSNLFYFDPPYVSKTRTSPNTYAIEWTNADHTRAAALLRVARGYVVVSGYACPLYAELYEAHGWVRVDKKAQTNGKEKIESIWMRPRTIAARPPQQAPLFAPDNGKVDAS